MESVAADRPRARLIERILVILGTPLGRERLLSPEDVKALRHASGSAAGFPRRLPAATGSTCSRCGGSPTPVRLFHLYVHEPLIRDALPELEIAEEMGELAADIPPRRAVDRLPPHPLLRYFTERMVGHGDGSLRAASHLGQVPVTLLHRLHWLHCTHAKEEGDLEAPTRSRTSPKRSRRRAAGGAIAMPIGDSDATSRLSGTPRTAAVGLLDRFPERPRHGRGYFGPRSTATATRFGTHVNPVHRVDRAQARGPGHRPAPAARGTRPDLRAVGVNLWGSPVATAL